MTIFKSLISLGTKPVQTPTNGMPVDLLYEYTTTAAVASGDIIDFGPLPAGLAPLDLTLIATDMDTGGSPAIAMSAGILNAGLTDMGSGTYDTFISASTVGQAGGVVRATTLNAYMCGASTSERRLGIKITTSPATGVASGSKLALILKVQP